MTTTTLQAARNGLVPARQTAPAVVPGFTSGEGFGLLQKMASMLNQSSLVPPQFQGPANLGNTAIALELASRIGASPLMTMQNLYVVNGRPAWSSAFLVASFNQCGRYSSIRYTFVGMEGTDSWGCYASATEKATGEKLDGTTITMGMARAEGWIKRNAQKWTNMPAQMLRYRAAAFFIRTYAPEIAMGLRTAEEEREMPGTDFDSPVITATVLRPEEAKNGDTSQIAQKGPSDARSEGTPSPTTQKPKTSVRRQARAVPEETQMPSPAHNEQEPPAPKSEPTPQAPASDPMDEVEQRFIALCEKADIAHGDMLDTYEHGSQGPFDPDIAIRDMVRNPDTFAMVLEDTRNRLARAQF